MRFTEEMNCSWYLSPLVSHFYLFHSLTEMTTSQVDLLWSCLVEDDECSDDALEWFVNQARNKDLHALDVPTFKYIFRDKVLSLILQTV